MSVKILINAVDPEICRIAKVKESQLTEFQTDSASREISHGNIYKGIITRIEPGLQAAFVDYGVDRNGFLQKHEIHSDYYIDNPTGSRSIQNIAKKGQQLLVQVTKDPIKMKGAMLTTYISLPGRFLVLMPGSDTRGISRQIEDENERKRLKEIVTSLKLPDGFGVIVRTAGLNCTKTMLAKDVQYLLRLWKNINKIGTQAEAPSLLYKERNLSVRSIRDYFTPDVTEILIDDTAVFREIKDFVQIISPKHTKIVKHYKGPKPIFSKHQLESQIASIYENRVDLKSGGSIVIDQTEALVAIDVNSGKATKGKSVEETAYATNMEAAEEISRQLRLRDLGGLIVIDFIDMRDRKHKQAVEKDLKLQLKTDKARTKIGRISTFGLMEMSRQRIRPSIDFGSYEMCVHCKGKGLVPSTETLGLDFLRKLHMESIKSGIKLITAIVPQEVADYLLNCKRKEIIGVENQHELSIVIRPDVSMKPGDCKITTEKMDPLPIDSCSNSDTTKTG